MEDIWNTHFRTRGGEVGGGGGGTTTAGPGEVFALNARYEWT